MARVGPADLFPRRTMGSEAIWNDRSLFTEVHEPVRNKDSVCTCIPLDIVSIRSAHFIAMMRVFLFPSAALSMVDVVSIDLLQATIEHRFFG